MAIGAATVEVPKPGMALPRAVPYQPPDFDACVARLKGTEHATSIAELRSRCRATYESIQRRILGFLITGYWLREAASEIGVLSTPAEVHKTFNEEKKAHFSDAASFQRLENATHQTVPDLEFAVETQMLSTKLLADFKKAHPMRTEQATIAAFNNSIKAHWIPKTNCEPGYVVPDCKEYQPSKAITTK